MSGVRAGSALQFVPAGVRRELREGTFSGSLRVDLPLIERAEAEGWTVTFHDGLWTNPAQFKRERIEVELSGRHYIRRHPDRDAEYFEVTRDGLAAALQLMAVPL